MSLLPLPSMAVFCPLSKAPKEEYLNQLHSFLSNNDTLKPLLAAAIDLEKTWSIFAKHRTDIAEMDGGPKSIKALAHWVAHGDPSLLLNDMSGILSLPLLTLIQIGQYFQFLQLRGISHREMLEHLKAGGTQGYCGGLFPAIAIACSSSEEEVVSNASIALRIALGVGAYAELGGEEFRNGSCTLVVRLKHEGQGEEIAQKFPGVYISAITDPKTISLVGPVPALARLQSYAETEGLRTQAMHVQGKVHNPENSGLSAELCKLSDQNESLILPPASSLRVPFRSNKTGNLIGNSSLTHEAISTILASTCQWYQLLTEVASDFQRTGRTSHVVAGFGIGDVVSLIPFRQAGLQISKLDAAAFIKDNLAQTPAEGQYTYPPDAIAVVGMSGRFPGADNVEEFWDLISSNKSKVREVPKERIDIVNSFRASQDLKWVSKRKFYGNFLDEIDSFDHAFFNLSSREADSMDPQQRVLLETAYQAMDSSGYLHSHDRKSGDGVGVFLGASFVEYLENTCARAPSSYTSIGTLRAFLSGRISYHFGWTGPSEVLDTACSSSLVAVHRACKAILAGECPMALAGGVNIMANVHNFFDLGKANFLSPTGQCKPFDQGADGYCRGEGVGLVVLKKLSQALASGDQILGVIPGAGTNQSGQSPALTIPHSPALVDLHRGILQRAGMRSDQVSYVEAHGTGTQAGDPIEMASIREAFGGPNRDNVVYVGSVKGNLGHLETAAGVTGLIKAIMMVNKGAIPPLTSHTSLNPKIPSLQPDKMAITTVLLKWQVPFRAVCVNSYGAAGSNSALLLCEGPQRWEAAERSPSSKELAYPIIITAASQSTLSRYADTLRQYLGNKLVKISIGDIALTLAEKRKHHQFRWTSTASNLNHLLKDLETGINGFSETPRDPKKVVLAFSGQTQSFVGLEKEFYDNHALFRDHLDRCNDSLLKQGFSAILPIVFQNEAVSDVVALQCGIFAVQYSCAKSWIESGLCVDAVLGHSLGELTALAVSDILSLEDALRLVATRASLITSNWGPERGVMLLIQASAEVVRDIISVSSKGNDVEIACFNAPESQVVVGTDLAITSVETVIQNEPRFRGTNSRRLDVTHGFHSRFTEDLLDDLDKAAGKLTFNAPSIHLESCTLHHLDQITPARIRQHTREPVAFYQAVRRVEQRLGSCVWLEAGVDSSVIPMIKRAVDRPDVHLLQPVKVKDAPTATETISSITTNLWREGIPVSYWNFWSAHKTDLKQQWLPPYQFNKVSHWLPYIDHAKANSIAPSVEIQKVEPPEILKLITPRQTPGESSVNLVTQRYQILVTGHAVLQRPLCPASLYMEFGVMAAAGILGDLDGRALWFKDLSYSSALGNALQRDVSLTLNRDKDRMVWSFVAKSTAQNDPRSRPTTHAKGEFGFTKNPQFQDFQRLVTDRINQFSKTSNVETLRRKRVYELFSRVVHYSGALQGISIITLGEYEALAEIDVPTQAETGESTVTRICDAVALDTFIQVVGVLINSSDICAKNEAFLTTGIDSVFISSTCDFERCKSWTVYAMFAQQGEETASGDVYVLTREGTLVLSFMGVQFSKMPLTKLERILDSGNPKATSEKNDTWREVEIPSTSSSNSVLTNSSEILAQDSNDTTPPDEEPNSFDFDSNVMSLKTVLASYFGISEEEIKGDANVGELGLDSLAAIELAGELATKYEKELEPEDILAKTVDELCQSVFGSRKVKPSASKAIPQTVQLPAQVHFTKPKSQHKQQLLKIISDVSGAPTAAIIDHMAMQEVGMDSLSLIELKTEIENFFSVELEDDDLTMDTTTSDLLKVLTPNDGSTEVDDPVKPAKVITEVVAPPPKTILAEASLEEKSSLSGNPLEILARCDDAFNLSAEKCGFSGYWAKVAPRQDELPLAYIAEGLRTLGVDLWKAQEGDVLPDFQHLPRHAKVVNRLWETLERLEITVAKGSKHIRTSKSISTRPSSVILDQLLEQFPNYAMDHRLMAATGSRLADCLAGKADATKILFGSSKSQKLLDDFYQNSPMFATLTDHLLTVLHRLVAGENRGVIKILEVGAGFGGTTVRVAEMLQASGRRVQYTFTDISPMLVKNARTTMAKYSWMDFKTLNLETDPPESLREQYDLVLATNVVHATSNLVKSTSRMRALLRSGGFIVLSEITKIIDWYELVFGLLEGWWLANDGRKHPLQSAEAWCRDLKEAGFRSAGASKSDTIESVSQQLIIGSTVSAPVAPARKSLDSMLAQGSTVDTVTYKVVDDTEIQADVFYPITPPSKPMPIALMFHGGGYITLSRKAIRPAQTLYLLDNGVLPISFDYRLCPEINLVDGPITDTRDALAWAKSQLPKLAQSRGIKVDTDRIVAIGWSTGGHLAMTMGWTAQEAGLKPPRAILNFYGQTDFDSADMRIDRLNDYPGRTMSLEEIRSNLSPKPITSYGSSTTDKSGLGWVRPGDPRSELVLSLFKERHALNILLNGMTSNDWQRNPSADRIAAVNPLAQLQRGKYTTPTFIIHGEKDELVPSSMSVQFEESMRAKQVKGGILVIPGAGHIHDLNLRPGEEKWNSGVLPGYEFLFEMLK